MMLNYFVKQNKIFSKDNFKNIFFLIAMIIIGYSMFQLGESFEYFITNFKNQNIFARVIIIVIGCFLFDYLSEMIFNSSFFRKLTEKKRKKILEKNQGAFILDFFRGKCFNCKKRKLYEYYHKDYGLDKVLKCDFCKEFNLSTIPNKYAFFPFGVCFLLIFSINELAIYNFIIYSISLLFSFTIYISLALKWTNKKLGK